MADIADELVLEVHRSVVMNSNDRIHHMVRHRKTKAIRRLAAARARQWGRTYVGPVRVVVTVQYLRGGRHDASNYQPTGKAAIDGCVDAGVLEDDDDTRVVDTAYRADVVKSARPDHLTLRLRFEPVDPDTTEEP